jgi:hypothetical protein
LWALIDVAGKGEDCRRREKKGEDFIAHGFGS